MKLIIDGDVLCYMACDPRWREKILKVNNVEYVSLEANGRIRPPEFTIEEDEAYLKKSWKNLQNDLQSLFDTFFTNDHLTAVKGPGNFRNLIYEDYKLNRHQDPQIANKFVPTLREMCVRQDIAVKATGREADDLMRIWAEQCRQTGEDYVICTIDKDLRCIPGKYYNMKNKTLEDISEIEALRHFYEQLLKGDPVDHIPGLPGVGPKRATSILSGAFCEEDFQEIVVANYLEKYGEDWYSYLLSNGKMLYLQKHPEDYFKLDWDIVKELR
jgi:5'-3' exonuclease